MDSYSWRVYERVVAALKTEEYASIDVGVQANAKILGHRSGVLRQIDILIDARFELDYSRRIIVDAKNYRSKIDINDVERFYGMMGDVSAARGILVCPSGWTNGAKRRAEGYIGLKLLTREEAEDYSEYLLAEICNCCKKGTVFFDNDPYLNVNGLWNIFRTGKCDHCHSFNVWCWDCGEHFGIRDGDDLKCGCDFTWYVSPPDRYEANEDELESLTAYLLLCVGSPSHQSELSPTVLCLDRRRGK